ncbi:(2Fe-2S)-binding protein [Paraburkholderia sediminicola]|uniref:(2Fe-2S)-binding protein n=1 Tax=Paraburkholderia TaxID=1822464 RepID=UPI0038B6E664
MRQGDRQCITLTLNSCERSGHCEPRELLSDFIRHELGATGTHVGCEHGVCGACTVHIDGVAGRSCLMLAVQAHGRRIDTVEGLAPDMVLGDLQQAFQRHHALQCGFCTAGILMSCADYLKHVPDPTEAEVRDMLSGHLCRCTGYTPIVAAVLDVAARRNAGKRVGETVETAHA